MDEVGHGASILWLNGSEPLWQVIPGYVVEANTTYTYSVDVGKPGIHPEYYSAPSFEIAGYDDSGSAGWVPLESGTFLANDEPAAGQWSTWVKTWTTGDNPAALGMPLAINLVGGGGIQTVFDNVQLDITPTIVPEGTIPVPEGDFEGEPIDSWSLNEYYTAELPYENMDEVGHGASVLWLNGDESNWQVLPGYVVEANTTYTYSVDVGKPGVNPDYYSDPSFEIAGYDGSGSTGWVPLESGTFLANDEPEAGQWSTWVKTWTTGDNPAALGMPLAINLVGGGGTQTVFDNVRLTATAVPVTVPGDANGDGKVNGSDVTILAGNWQVGVDGLTEATWAMGDFNGDKKVDGSDVTILAGNWQTGVTAAAAAVPEPSTLVMLVTLASGLMIWRRRSSKI